MQLEFSLTGRQRIELWRCQWRPFETHTNKAWGPDGYELARFRQRSHHHPFHENWMITEKRLRAGSLPAALPIDPDPSTLSKFIAFCGQEFRIRNIELVSLPQATPDFFWTADD